MEEAAIVSLNQSAMQRGAALVGSLGIALLSVHGQPALGQHQHTLPLVTSADAAQQGFVRIINLSDRPGTVTIHAIDDAGERYGPVSLELEAAATAHFNSTDLEEGNESKALTEGVGDGEGNWRLELNTDIIIEPLAYIRTSDGFVTSMNDVVLAEYVPGVPGQDDQVRHVVRFFNPGGNSKQVSQLRVINTAGIDNKVVVSGLDDAGEEAPDGEVRFTLPPYGARMINARELEVGADDLEGSLGDGTGKWQLTIAAEIASLEERRGVRPIQVMSLLLSTDTGNLTNLSAIGVGNDSNRGGAGTEFVWGGSGDDILNTGDNDDRVDGTFGSTGNDTIVYTDSGPTAFQWLGYYGLATGITATINGVTNVGTVDKGSSGFDTIVDIANPLNAAGEPPYGGFGMGGTHLDDHFDLTLAEGQWMDVRGEAGNDTINIRSGTVKVNYRHTPNGVNVDLAAGRASNDGHGDVDTIIGKVRELEGGLGDDTLLGSSGRDRLGGGPGNDVLNPRTCDCGSEQIFGSTGNDRIVYSDTGSTTAQNLYYDRPWSSNPSILADSDGIVVTVDGAANTATVDKGPDGTDTIVDVEKAFAGWGVTIQGTRADDVFNLTLSEGQWMDVNGGPGNDRFNLDVYGFRIDFQFGSHGARVDLAAGRAYDDGYGTVDIINGSPSEVQGTNFDDELRGSDRNESFIGRHGDDVIDGRGGFDRVRYDRGEVQSVEVDLEAGRATGTWEDGTPFTHALTSIESVRGSDHNDLILGSSGDDRLEGRGGNDEIRGRGGDDRLQGQGGEDVFVFERGHGEDTIKDFTDGEDLLVFKGLDLSSKSQVLEASHPYSEGVGVWIDLRPFGGGTLSISGLHHDDFDESDFLL